MINERRRRASTPRAGMVDATAISDRLSDDMVAVAAERGGVEAWHLTELGWTAAQIRLHAPAVADALKLAA